VEDKYAVECSITYLFKMYKKLKKNVTMATYSQMWSYVIV